MFMFDNVYSKQEITEIPSSMFYIKDHEYIFENK